MTMDAQAPPRFDPRDGAFLADPYPVYRQLREAGPISRGGPGQWVVARHAEVAALLREPRLSHEFPEQYQQLALGNGPACGFVQQIVLYREGPSHQVLRRLLRRALNVTPVDRLRARIEELVRGLLDAALERGRLDAMADLAFPLPVAVACELVGIPAEERDLVRDLATVLSRAFTVVLAEDERPAVDRAATALRACVADLLDRPGRPQPLDVLTSGLDDEAGGVRIGRDDVVDNVIFLLLGGFTTTVHLIAAGCAALLRHPDQQARLRADPSLVPLAVEEFLRYDAPIQHVGRIATEAFELGGRTIRPGRIVHLLLASANRDERRFTDPDRLDIGRHPNPHLSFGGGAHLCLGATLGRLEAAVVFEQLLQRCAAFEPAGEAVRTPTQVFRTYASIPAAVRA
jgi:cytochrome P450